MRFHVYAVKGPWVMSTRVWTMTQALKLKGWYVPKYKRVFIRDLQGEMKC